MKRLQPGSCLIASVSFVVLLSACGGAAPTPVVTSAPASQPVPPATHTPPPPPTVTYTPLPPPTVAPSATAAPDASVTLTSSAFAEGEAIPDQYTYRLAGQCDGANLSPELTWVGAPAGAQSFALIMDDPDAGNFAHWVQFNIPGDAASLPEAEAGPDIGLKGQNDFGEIGYGGPCPPSGTHRYIITLYALDVMLPASEGAARSDIENAMAGHILAQTQLTGLRSR